MKHGKQERRCIHLNHGESLEDKLEAIEISEAKKIVAVSPKETKLLYKINNFFK